MKNKRVSMYFLTNKRLAHEMRYLKYLIINTKSHKYRSTNKIMSCGIEKKPKNPYKSFKNRGSHLRYKKNSWRHKIFLKTSSSSNEVLSKALKFSSSMLEV